jgi:hypothetical protein
MDLLDRISKLAVELDWYVAFEGKSKGNRHLERTSAIAAHLLGMEGEKCGDRFVVLAGAWLHDVGLIVGNLDHASKGKMIANALLRCLAVEDATRERIEHCVEAHDRGVEGIGVEARTIEAKIVHDADTLDKIGPLGVLRHSWKKALELPAEQLLTHLRHHLAQRMGNLYLDSSRQLAVGYEDSLEAFFASRETALSVLRVIGQCAKEGIPSEQVVEHLEGIAPADFLTTLREQLDLETLRR